MQTFLQDANRRVFVYRITSLQIRILCILGALKFPLYKMPKLEMQDKVFLNMPYSSGHYAVKTCRKIRIY